MSGLVTDPRVIVDTAVGIDWQAAEDEAIPSAPFSPAQFVVARSMSRDPDPSYIQPDGSHGSIHRRFEGTRITTQAFKKELALFGSRHQLLPFLEGVMNGEPTTAFSELTLGGSGAGNISDLSFVGIRPYHNASPFITNPTTKSAVFIQMTESPGFPVTVDFFSDAALTIQVGTAVVASSGTPTPITPVGGSGLSGSVTLSAAATDTANAVIDKINYTFENQFTRFFRLFYTDSSEVVILSDCVVQALGLESSESGELVATIQVMAKRRDIIKDEALIIPQVQLDLVTYSHSELTLTRDPSGSPFNPVVDQFAFNVENNVLQYLGNAPTPQKLIKRGFVEIGGNLQGEMADEFEKLIDDARANTDAGAGFKDLRAEFELSTKKTRFEMRKVRFRLAEPGFTDDIVEKATLDYEAHFDGVDSPLDIFVEL